MKKIVFLVLMFGCAYSFADDLSKTNTAAGSSDNDLSGGSYNTGGYGEVQLGSGNSSGLNSGVNSAAAFRVDVGDKINPYFGFEGGITMLGKPSAGNFTAGLQFFDVSATGYLPLGNYFDFHGQVGMAYVSVNSVENFNPGGLNQIEPAFKGLIGVGFDAYVSKSCAITVNDYNYVGTASLAGGGNTNVIMGGFKYDFR